MSIKQKRIIIVITVIIIIMQNISLLSKVKLAPLL